MADLYIPTKKAKSGKASKKDRQWSHNRATGRYTRQRLRTARNKARSRAKHLANHPNDLQAIADLKRLALAADVERLQP